MSRKAKPGLELLLTCISAGQEDPAGLSEWLAVRSESLTSRFKLIFSIQECIFEPSTVFFYVWPREMAGLIPWIKLKCQYLYPHASLDFMLLLSQCAGQRQFLMWNGHRPTVLGSQEFYLSALALIHRRYSGRSSARNTFSVLGDVVMFSLSCQETSFVKLH